jgi:hypothetical protein
MDEESMHCTLRNVLMVVVGSLAVLILAVIASLAAYKTHTESDSEFFFKTYPQVVGTRLDSCDACHIRVAALPPGQKSGKDVKLSTCDSCHRITDHGRKPGNTLTSYGLDYKKNGRSAAAFAAIANLDSDADGVSNGAEIEAKTNPGDPLSAPDKQLAPHIVLSYDDLVRKRIPVHEQAIFVNVTKSKDGDSYSDVRGFKLIDVLDAAGMAKEATSIDVISLDGYTTTFSVAQLRRAYPQAEPVFGLDKEILGECGWVRYEAKSLKPGVKLPDANVLLAFVENGKEYPPSTINDQQRLIGSGPFRVVAPQMINPGIPDISSRATDACIQKVPNQYHFNRDYEKNSDYCVKAVVAIRVNPMPTGMMDIHWPQHAKKSIEEKSILIFGGIKSNGR